MTVLCCLGAGLIGVLSVLSKQSSADLAGFVVYIIAAVLVIRSVIFVNPRSKSATKKDKLSLSPSLPVFPLHSPCLPPDLVESLSRAADRCRQSGSHHFLYEPSDREGQGRAAEKGIGLQAHVCATYSVAQTF